MRLGLYRLLAVVGLLTGCDSADIAKPDSTGSSPSISSQSSATETNTSLQGTVRIDGSSTVYPISEAASSAFCEKFTKVDVTVGVKGTGGGFSEFSKGSIDISDASRPIKQNELAECVKNGIRFFELPIAYDGLAICVHKDNDFLDEISIEDLKTIYSADTAPKSWKDVNASFPDQPMKVFMPGTDSGTYDFFKEVVIGKEGNVRSDLTPSEQDLALVNGIASEKYAIGFFGASYYFESTDKLKALKVIDPKTKQAIAPSAETIENSTYSPLGRPLFIYVNAASVKRPELRKFVEYYIDHASDICRSAKCVPLTDALYQTVRQRFDDRVEGTYFYDEAGNSRIGSLSEIYIESNLTQAK
ncbi:MAG: PstS family phosphate ABC transporter substrate-binding protein [Pirellulaceae bacterium]|nr:PstS family phosphate ABC transporter substrate-binding protein [Pirellulaceae bacterium]